MASSSQSFKNYFKDLYRTVNESMNNASDIVTHPSFQDAFLHHLKEILQKSSATNKEQLINRFTQIFKQDIDDIYKTVFNSIIELSRHDQLIGQFIDIFCKNFIEQITGHLKTQDAVQNNILIPQFKQISLHQSIKSNFNLNAMLQFVIIDFTENNCIALKSGLAKYSIDDFIGQLHTQNNDREGDKSISGTEVFFKCQSGHDRYAEEKKRILIDIHYKQLNDIYGDDLPASIPRLRTLIGIYDSLLEPTIKDLENITEYKKMLAEALRVKAIVVSGDEKLECLAEAIRCFQTLPTGLNNYDLEEISGFYTMLGDIHLQLNQLTAAIEAYFTAFNLLDISPDAFNNSQTIRTKQAITKNLIELHMRAANNDYCNGEFASAIKNLEFVLKHDWLHEEILDTCWQFIGLSFFGIAGDLIKIGTDPDVINEALSDALTCFENIKQPSTMDEKMKASNYRTLFAHSNQANQQPQPPDNGDICKP